MPKKPIPVAAQRFSRLEALIVEIRHEQDVQLKRITALHLRIDELTEIAGLAWTSTLDGKAPRRLKRPTTSRKP